jgi:5-methyltetrahydrofolate--homocysteine methyltransferase
MLIIGERINTSRKAVNEAVECRDAAFIQTDILAQVEAGAYWIDLNAGSRLISEAEDLLWLIKVAEKVVDLPLSLDSSNPQVLVRAIGQVKKRPLLNSITAEQKHFDQMKPVIQERECDIVALCMDDEGPPKTVDKILKNAERLIHDLEILGVTHNRIYLDPLIQPLSINVQSGLIALEAIRLIQKEFPGVHTVCGISNISYCLPGRSPINRVFLGMAMEAGLYAAILDPLDKKVMTHIRVIEMLLGQDDFCLNYIRAFREGKILL